jgi:hypothetical protein
MTALCVVVHWNVEFLFDVQAQIELNARYRADVLSRLQQHAKQSDSDEVWWSLFHELSRRLNAVDWFLSGLR